jgi:hypothetical protein
MLTDEEKEELEFFRQSAHRFMTSDLDKAFFALESLMDRDRPHRVDSVMPTSAFSVLAKALIELKKTVMK